MDRKTRVSRRGSGKVGSQVADEAIAFQWQRISAGRKVNDGFGPHLFTGRIIDRGRLQGRVGRHTPAHGTPRARSAPGLPPTAAAPHRGPECGDVRGNGSRQGDQTKLGSLNGFLLPVFALFLSLPLSLPLSFPLPGLPNPPLPSTISSVLRAFRLGRPSPLCRARVVRTRKQSCALRAVRAASSSQGTLISLWLPYTKR